MLRYRVLAPLALLLVLVLPARAEALDPVKRLYVPAGSVDAAALIGPPPKLGSPKFHEQMAIVLWLQKTRTPAQVAFVEKTLDTKRFAPLVAAELFDVDGIELEKTIDDAISEVRDDYDALKAVFDLPRPFQVNDAVKPVGDARPVASYPSGHAIRAIVYARLLAEIFPDKKDALMDLAIRVSYGRVIAGVHYPDDIISGQKLGHAYADVIVEQPAFKEAVKRIRQD